jgi:hypothetical protein
MLSPKVLQDEQIVPSQASESQTEMKVQSGNRSIVEVSGTP